jgi:predicted metallo-beta-lactamase superfamily hydrolase
VERRRHDSDYFYELSKRVDRVADAAELERRYGKKVSSETLKELRGVSEELFEAYRDELAREARVA